MTVNRLSNLTIYLDGNLIKTVSSQGYEGFGASMLTFGSYVDDSQQPFTFSMPFRGHMDEIRIWNGSHTQSHIKKYKNHSLKGSEFGLRAYFPFEDVTIEDPSLSNETTTNFAGDEPISSAADASLVGNATFDIVSPGIKLQKPEIDILFSYAINNDEVIITPNIDGSLIENQVLQIAVKRVRDLNNNLMESTINWTAFINRNGVTWNLNNISLEKLREKDTTFSVYAINKSGGKESFSVTGVPSWLTATPKSGDLDPLQQEKIQFTIGNGLNIGTYSTDVNLVSSLGYNERLNLQLKVKTSPPGWAVDPEKFQHSASLIGRLTIANIVSTDKDDLIACFVGNEVRGVTKVTHLPDGDLYLLFMDIYSNVLSGETLTFKVFDASTGKVYADVQPELKFEAGKVFGSPATPVEFSANDYIEQLIALKKGWNWLSFNVANRHFSSLDSSLSGFAPSSGEVIKSLTSYAQYTSQGHWLGSLKSLSNHGMYKVFASKDRYVSILGKEMGKKGPAISITAGWNWIGYPLYQAQAVKEAFSSLSPTDGDIIKTQQKFAIYDSRLGWIGSLKFVDPGKGYMIKYSAEGTLFYPTPTSFGAGSKTTTPFSEAEIAGSENNMNVIAAISALADRHAILYAFSGGALIGASEAEVVGDSILFFLSINQPEANEVVEFKFKSSDMQGLTALNETITYSDNSLKGSIQKPFSLTSVNNAPCEHQDNLLVYPNPIRSSLHLNYIGDEAITIELYNFYNQRISTKRLDARQTVIWDDTKYLPDGLYYLRYYGEKMPIETIKLLKLN